MLEACCSTETSSLLELLDKLPRVECVEEVDVSRTSVKNFDRQFAFGDEDTRRLLIWVAAVLEC